VLAQGFLIGPYEIVSALWREIAVSDSAGVLGDDLSVLSTPDGLSHALVFYRTLSTLYLVSGLR
jgi:hypothetical protein